MLWSLWTIPTILTFSSGVWYCTVRGYHRSVPMHNLTQVAAQLEAEKTALLQKKRQQQAERKRKQEELDRILQENKRKASFIQYSRGPT